MPNFLALDARAGAACQAVLYTNGSPAVIGDPFGVAYANATSAVRSSMTVQFAGELFGMASDGMYQKDDPLTTTGPWTQVIAFVTPITTDSSVGIFVLGDGLVGVYPGSSGRFRWVKYDGTVWTQAASDDVTLSNNPNIKSMVVYHDVIYWVGAVSGNTSRSFSYDHTTDNFSDLTPGGLWGGPIGLCVFEDRLFGISSYDSGGSRTYRLLEFNGSAWISVETFEPFTNSTSWALASWSLFTDGATMTALVGDDSGGTGWRAFEWDTSLVRSEITVATIPTSLRWTGAAGGAWTGNIGTARFFAVYDLNSAIGTSDIYLYHATTGTGGTGFAVYKWNGNASLMTLVDSGGNVEHALPHSHLGFGERIFTAGELDVRPISRLGVIGGEQFSFTAHGGGTGRKVKLQYLLKGTPPLIEATLKGPVTGGSATLNTGLNQVENVDADGVTVYSVVWDVVSDALTTSDRVIRAIEVLA